MFIGAFLFCFVNIIIESRLKRTSKAFMFIHLGMKKSPVSNGDGPDNVKEVEMLFLNFPRNANMANYRLAV